MWETGRDWDVLLGVDARQARGLAMPRRPPPAPSLLGESSFSPLDLLETSRANNEGTYSSDKESLVGDVGWDWRPILVTFSPHTPALKPDSISLPISWEKGAHVDRTMFKSLWKHPSVRFWSHVRFASSPLPSCPWGLPDGGAVVDPSFSTTWPPPLEDTGRQGISPC